MGLRTKVAGDDVDAAAFVSPEAGALRFRTRFYLDSVGKQPDYANKVQLTVKVSELGLSELEKQRLLAVASRHYDRKRGVLVLTSRHYAEVARNKAMLRDTVRQLVADARENAEHVLMRVSWSSDQGALCATSRAFVPIRKLVMLP